MATAEDALAKMREICLALPDTREGDHFGDTAFFVKGKLFATCGGKHGACEIVLGLQPDHAAALVASDPRFRPYPRDRRAVVIDAASVKSWREVRTLVSESYDLRKPADARGRAARTSARAKRPRR